MSYRRWGALVGILAAGVGAFAACVGDDGSTPDSGSDASQTDGSPSDVTTVTDGGVTDAEGGIGPVPTPNGSLVWLHHYNNNVVPTGNQAFADLAVNENGGLTYVLAGRFATDPNAGNQFHFGTVNLGPATGYDLLSGGLNGTGSSVWATSPQASATANGTNDWYASVVVDGGGNLYVFGSTYGASVKLKDTLTGPTSFVAKLTASGTPVWDHAFTQAAEPVQGPVAVALSGSSLVVAMTYAGSVTYDTGLTFTPDGGGSDPNVFLAALDPSTGATKWTGSFGSSGYDNVAGMASTPQGHVVLTGTMSGTMTGLPGPGMPLAQLDDSGMTRDAYVLDVDPSGNATYGLVYGGAASSSVSPAAIAYRNGVVAVAGSFYGAVDFGKGLYTASGTDGVVFTVDEATKKTTFAAQLAGAATDSFTTVALDPWNEIVAAGTYGASNASAQLGAQALPQTSNQVGAMVLAKWSPTGTMLWAHGYVPTLDGGAPPYALPDAGNVFQSIVPSRVQVTSTGQVVVAGTMAGGTDFGTGYEGQLSTMAYPRCTCTGIGGCNKCVLINAPACCDTITPGASADGIVGVWQP